MLFQALIYEYDVKCNLLVDFYTCWSLLDNLQKVGLQHHCMFWTPAKIEYYKFKFYLGMIKRDNDEIPWKYIVDNDYASRLRMIFIC